jgi:hypothetical protein
MSLREKWKYAQVMGRKLISPSSETSFIGRYKMQGILLLAVLCIVTMPHKALAHFVTALQSGSQTSETSPECLNAVMLIILWFSMLVGMARKKRSLIIKLTWDSFEGLHQEGVPEEIIAQAKKLIGLEYSSEESFIEALEEAIGKAELKPYKLKFLKHAEYPKSQKRSQPACCCDCCDCCYLGDCSGYGDCNGDGACDCGDCDCGGCDCGDCDCGGCDCG